MAANRVDSPRAMTKAQTTRRSFILDVALGMLKSRSFEQVQMREISETAGFAIGTLYRYFPSKELLLAHVLERWCEGYWEELQHASEGSANVDRLYDVSRRSIRAFEEEPNFLAVANSLQLSREPEIVTVMARIGQRSHQFFTVTLVGIATEEAEAIADALLAVIEAKLSLWMKGRIPIGQVYASVEKCVHMLLEFQDPTASPATGAA